VRPLDQFSRAPARAIPAPRHARGHPTGGKRPRKDTLWSFTFLRQFRLGQIDEDAFSSAQCSLQELTTGSVIITLVLIIGTLVSAVRLGGNMARDLKTCPLCDKVFFADLKLCPHCKGHGPARNYSEPTVSHRAISNVSYRPLIAVLAFVVVCCAVVAMTLPKDAPSPPAKTPDVIAAERAEKARIAAEIKQAQRDSDELQANLKKATPAQLLATLAKCSSGIQSLADKSGSKFGSFIVDEDSAMTYQVAVASMSGPGTMDFSPVYDDERRVKDFIKARDEYHSEYLAGNLNLEHVVLFTGDTFSGLKKFPVKYKCDLTPKLDATARKVG
jgi:hypothetical protein